VNPSTSATSASPQRKSQTLGLLCDSAETPASAKNGKHQENAITVLHCGCWQQQYNDA